MDTAVVAVALNQEILERMADAARGYVDHLLARVHTSNQLERRTVSRDLHDVVAPAVALGLQNLELWEIYRDQDPDRALSKIQNARTACVAAVDTIRSLSAYLRVDVDDVGLAAGLQRYLDTLPPPLDRSLRVSGPLDRLPTPYTQELFLIVREAIRNAAQHAEPASIDIELTAAAAAVTASINDDGHGFDLEKVTHGGLSHVGLDSMRERAQLLSAALSITSRPGHGTLVHVIVPLAGAAGLSP